MQDTGRCFFNDCFALVLVGSWKCHFHRHRARCVVLDCRNQVYARQRCVKHGGKRQCQVVGCSANSRVGHLCSQHASDSLKALRRLGRQGQKRKQHAATKTPTTATKTTTSTTRNGGSSDDGTADVVLLNVSIEPMAYLADEVWDMSLLALDKVCMEALRSFDVIRV
ncbi:Aste57867_4808 [Aphanomyces stellatus]|uniref:Aste57867_4808 protein n=1 Tax=Aphanomyces stellatus TaxID=120398 RepID=A0A485KDN2_9STRA|nr:hypothetical protein As57867_004795 [Aphanomyces stellatus]VFT81902.1 Aste57867_4808 [Aphanomyces stellatus]